MHITSQNKRNEIQSSVSTNNPDVFCFTQTLSKTFLQKIEGCGIQIDGYDCFSNVNNSNCRRAAAIYTKRDLNARSYLTNHEVIILNRSNSSQISIETSVPQQASGFIIKYCFGISQRADKKRFAISLLANSQCPIMFRCANICVSYWLSHNNQ